MAEVPALYSNWKRVTRTVIASIRTNIDLVAPILQRDLHPESPEGTDVRDHYLAKAAALERKVGVLEERALAVLAERADDVALESDRLAAVSEVRERVIRTRSMMQGAYSRELLAKVGLTGETPVDVDKLVTYAKGAVSGLRGTPLPAPEDGASVDAARRAELIEQALTRLDALTDGLALEARQEQQAIQARDVAETAVRLAYIAAADGFAADTNAAGFPAIADRVRPTARRRLGLPEEDDVEDPNEG